MINKLAIFREDFLNANTWEQRREGVPLDLLDNLSAEELKIAEGELIQAASANDSWPIIGLGHIKSTQALPKLYWLLDESEKAIKITIAHSIYQINGDSRMIDIVLAEMPNIKSPYQSIGFLYMLPHFNDERVTALLNALRFDKDYHVAYNATAALGLPTDEVVKRFVRKDRWRTFWRKFFN